MKALATFILIFVTSVVTAQPPPPATGVSKIGWNMEAPTLADAQGYTYRYYADGATTGVALPSATVVCTGTASPFSCEAPFPAFTPGAHTLTLTAGNLAGESPKSDPLGFVFVVTPGKPAALRIVGG